MIRLLPILVLTACFGDARKDATIAYATQMQELMLENDDIGREFLDTALRIKKDELMPQDVADRLDKQRLGDSRYAFQQEVPARKQCDQDPLDDDLLADDGSCHGLAYRIGE